MDWIPHSFLSQSFFKSSEFLIKFRSFSASTNSVKRCVPSCLPKTFYRNFLKAHQKYQSFLVFLWWNCLHEESKVGVKLFWTVICQCFLSSVPNAFTSTMSVHSPTMDEARKWYNFIVLHWFTSTGPKSTAIFLVVLSSTELKVSICGNIDPKLAKK